MNGADDLADDVTFGLFVPTIGPPASRPNLRRMGRVAEDHGLDALWAGEHLAFPAEMSDTYPFTTSGEPPATLDAGEKLLSVLESMAYLAGTTSTVTVGTNVCLAPLYHPVDLVKRVFTLDELSNGRFEFGVGLGWMPEEYDLLGVPFEERGDRLDEFLEILTRARSEEQFEFDGEYTSFPETGFRPTPPDGRPNVWIGGKSGATFRRVAEFGDGWTIVRDTPGQVREVRTRLLSAWDDYDREGDPDIALARPLHVGTERGRDSPLAGPVTKIQEDIRRYVDAGVTHFAFMFYTTDIDEQLAQVDRLANHVLAGL